MRALAVVVAVSLLASCTPARPASAPPPHAVVINPCSEPPDTGDLSGGWKTGTGNAPDVEELVLHVGCAEHPAVWRLEQTGTEIRAWEFPASFDQGIASAVPVARIDPLLGRVCGRVVTFGDGGSFRVRYDPATRRMEGVRDGSAFWAVRQRVVSPSPCPGIP